MLYEINRVMAPGGLLIIREHHSETKEMNDYIDLEHMLYQLVVDWRPDVDPATSTVEYFNKTYFAHYYSKQYLTLIMRLHMFERIKTPRIIKYTDNVFYAMYRKINNAMPIAKYSRDTLVVMYSEIQSAIAGPPDPEPEQGSAESIASIARPKKHRTARRDREREFEEWVVKASKMKTAELVEFVTAHI